MAIPYIEKEKPTGERAFELWHDRLTKALVWRQEHWNGDRAWKRALRMVRGDHWSSGVDDVSDLFSDSPREYITVNVTGSTVEDFIPFLVRRKPEFTVRPKRVMSVDTARNQMNLLNYLWHEKGLTRQLVRAVRDSVIIGHGVVKTGYRFELQEAALKPGVQISYDDAIRDEEPWARRISPFHFVFDPDANDHDLASARWCAEILFRPMQDVLEDKRYKKNVVAQIRAGTKSPTTHLAFLATHTSGEGGITNLTQSEQRAQELVVLWEVWDKRFRKRLVFIDGVDEPVIEEDWPYSYLDGFPYEMVSFIELPDEHYALGMVRFIEDQQMELNRVRTKEFNDHRRTGVLLTAAKNFVSETELNKATNGSALEIILHDGSPTDSPIQAVNLPTELFKSAQLQSVIYDDMRRMTGSDALMQGGDLKSRTSATEVNTRAQFFGLKLEDKVDRVDGLFARVARQILQHVQANMKTPKLILPLGINAARATAEHFQNMTPEMIRGEFDLEVSTVSAERVDRATDRQQRLQVMQILLQQLQLILSSGAKLDIAELFRWVLETFDIKDMERFFPEGAMLSGPLADGTAGPAVATQPGGISPAESQVRLQATPADAGVTGALLGTLSGGDNEGAS